MCRRFVQQSKLLFYQISLHLWDLQCVYCSWHPRQRWQMIVHFLPVGGIFSPCLLWLRNSSGSQWLDAISEPLRQNLVWKINKSLQKLNSEAYLFCDYYWAVRKRTNFLLFLHPNCTVKKRHFSFSSCQAHFLHANSVEVSSLSLFLFNLLTGNHLVTYG